MSEDESLVLPELSNPTEYKIISTKIIQILKQKKPCKYDGDYFFLIKLLKTLKFFRENKSLESNDYVIICHNLSYEFYKENEYVYKFNSAGEKFYIIIEGIVSVLIPKDPSKNEFNNIEVDNYIFDLEKGKSFGESALKSNSLRNESILCKSDCHFAVLSVQSYANIFKEKEEIIQQRRVEFIKTIPFFQSWTYKNFVRLKSSLNLLEYEYGQQVYKTGDKVVRIFVIFSGEFEAKCLSEFQDSSNLKTILNKEETKSLNNIPYFNKQKNIKKICLKIYGKGSLLGEDEALKYGKHYSTVQCCSQRGELLSFSAEEFKSIVKDLSESTKHFQDELKHKFEILEGNILTSINMITKPPEEEKNKERKLKYVRKIEATRIESRIMDFVDNFKFKLQKENSGYNKKIIKKPKFLEKLIHDSDVSNAKFNLDNKYVEGFSNKLIISDRTPERSSSLPRFKTSKNC